MRDVYRWFGTRSGRVAGDLGIEIEVEGERLPVANKYWRNEEDGSLRGPENREYVLSKPLDLAGCKEALTYLDGLYVDNNTNVHDTVRAGVHVHVNCQSLTITQLYNFITLYIVLEEALVKWCGEHREGNLFCLRTGDAEFFLKRVCYAAETGAFHTLYNDDLRYCSINVKSLKDYGSLEFRAMRGTRDLNLIYKWAEMLLNLREAAKKYNSPIDIIHQYSDGGAHYFLQKHLGSDELWFEGANEAIKAGMRRAQQVAYCCDWERYYERPIRLIGDLEFDVNDDPDEPLGDY